MRGVPLILGGANARALANLLRREASVVDDIGDVVAVASRLANR